MPAQEAAAIEDLVRDPSRPLLMFSLRWCNFYGSLRRLFKAISARHDPVDLDALALQAGDCGMRRLHAALAARTGANMLSQVFVGRPLARRLH